MNLMRTKMVHYSLFAEHAKIYKQNQKERELKSKRKRKGKKFPYSMFGWRNLKL